MKKDILPLLLIAILAIWGMGALFHGGLWTAHDIWHQVARFYHYRQALLDGQVPPYWIGTLALGFGYPLFFFSYHLPWILGLPFLGAGLDIPTTLKILFFGSYLFSGIFMYLFARELFRTRPAALLVATLYLWAPFRFQTILVSAAMGTSFVFVFLPLLFWGIYKITQGKTESGQLLAAIGLAGVLLSHLMSFVALTPLVFLFTLWAARWQKIKALANLLKAGLLGLMLSAFYLLPAAAYSQLTQVKSGTFATLYQKFFVNLSQLIYSKWGYGIINTSAKEGSISFQVGLAQWLAVGGLAVALVWWFSQRGSKFFQKTSASFASLGLVFLASFAASIFVMLETSRPLWQAATKIVSLDMPTMFLLPAMTVASMSAGLLFVWTKKFTRPILFVALILLALYTNRNHLRVNQYTDFPVSLYVDSETTTNSFHEYLPSSANVNLLYQREIPFITPAEVAVTDIKQDTRSLAFSVVVPGKTEVTVHHFSFPGIVLLVDAKKTNFSLDSEGRIKFLLEAGNHQVLVQFAETGPIKVGKLLTLIGAAWLLLICFRAWGWVWRWASGWRLRSV